MGVESFTARRSGFIRTVSDRSASARCVFGKSKRERGKEQSEVRDREERESGKEENKPGKSCLEGRFFF